MRVWEHTPGPARNSLTKHHSPQQNTTQTAAAGNPEGDASPPFSDVPSDSWYTDDVRCLVELGVTTGTSPSMFSPDDDVSRAQMASFLARAYRAAQYAYADVTALTGMAVAVS